jgi:hypothetical protein
MPFRSEYVLSAVFASFTAVGVSHFVAYSTTFRFGYFAFMQVRKPFLRSSPLIEARSPSSMRRDRPLRVRADVVARRLAVEDVVGPDDHVDLALGGATSTLTTGMCLLAAYASVGAIARCRRD